MTGAREPLIIAPKGVRDDGRSPDLAYRLTDKDGRTLHLGVDQGDVIGVLIRGAPAPLPFRVVAVDTAHGRMSLAPLGREPANKDGEQ